MNFVQDGSYKLYCGVLKNQMNEAKMNEYEIKILKWAIGLSIFSTIMCIGMIVCWWSHHSQITWILNWIDMVMR